jgi:tRNA A37 threonylcarbamoyladenosine modification protein TsaB
MILIIDTTKAEVIKLALAESGQLKATLEIATERNQAELLLPSIEDFLKKQKQPMKDLEAIEVVNGEGSFSNLRLGIVTANALGYAYGVPVRDNSGLSMKAKGLTVIDPIYNGEPKIGQ